MPPAIQEATARTNAPGMHGVGAVGALPLLPTLPGFVDGIVGVDPLHLQCHDCAATLINDDPRRRGAVFVILSGWHFHGCEGRAGVRRCQVCLAAAVAGCPAPRCRGGWR